MFITIIVAVIGILFLIVGAILTWKFSQADSKMEDDRYNELQQRKADTKAASSLSATPTKNKTGKVIPFPVNRNKWRP